MSIHTIVSTPEFPKTVIDIQQLVDSAQVHDGDTIELKGTFSAQPTDKLFLQKSVTLQGDPVEGTAIVGGLPLQWGVTPQDKAVPVAATIDSITFKGFTLGAIRMKAASVANVISNCRFEDYLFGVKPPREGAWPIVVDPSGNTKNIAGDLTIRDCFFGAPLAASVPAAGMNNLMHFNNCDLHHLLITRNTIEDMYWMGIVVWGVAGLTEIVENTITRRSTWVARFGTGNAISFGLRPSGYPMDRDGSLILERNTINIDNADSYGIIVGLYPESTYLSSPVPPTPRSISVRDNVVHMNGDPSGVKNDRAAVACLGACSDAIVANNVITGTSRFGILVSQDVPSIVVTSPKGPRNIQFLENQLAGGTMTDPTDGDSTVTFDPFTATQAQVHVGASAGEIDVRLNTLGPVLGKNTLDWPPPLSEPCAGIVWHGFDGEIVSNDFASSGIEGWSPGHSGGAPGQQKPFEAKLQAHVGCIYLSEASNGNLVEYNKSDFPTATVPPPERQILDLSKPNTITEVLKLKPEKPEPQKVGPPSK